METLDQSNNNQVSDRAIRNLSAASVWVIIVSCVGILLGLFFLYVAFQAMSNSYSADQGGVMLIFALIAISMHAVGLSYGISLSKLKVFSTEDFEKATSKQMAYWIFLGIIHIIFFLLFLMGIASGGGNFRF